MKPRLVELHFSEMDVNPLMIHEEGYGATVADCRIILKKLDVKNKGD